MRGFTGLGGRGLRVAILSLFVIVLFYTVGNFFERTVPYALDPSETAFYPPNAVDARPPDELVSPEVTTLSDEEHPASAKWHHEAMSKIKDKIGAWLPMDKVHGMYGAMRRPPWIGHGKSMDTDTDTPNYNHAPSPAKEERNAIVGKISILNHPQNEYIDRAVKTHAEHDRRHGYQHYTMREQIASNPAENFAAQMLSILQAELRKPPSKRLEWLYYFPTTSIILNPNVPLELFIPPTKGNTAFNETYLLYAAAAPEGPPSTTSPPSPDLSHIAFAARVSQWSIDLFTTLVTRTKSAASGSKKQQASSRADALTISSLLNLPSSSALSPQKHLLALPPNWLNAWPSSTSSSSSSIDDVDDREETKGGDGDVDVDIRPGSFALILPLLPLSQNSTSSMADAAPAPPPSSSAPSAFFFDGEDAASAAARDRFERWLARAEARSPRWETPLRETSVHNWRQEVSEEVRRATESRCGRAREALAEVELDYGDGENEAGQDQAARAKLQAVIAGLRKVS
ncbi:putative galactosyl transferase gma12 mnn10 family protein [Diplodia seriata]|uniref:Putative galactosyl transferase gma12 mnn10 family protein n=1 Tax=Diplodia seriata TaxID=420778 RepID=A0A0G2ECB7_9PEZI|nr:putative galactosyl transferase gma12 mnn10 family protein [Diplodia seriata]